MKPIWSGTRFVGDGRKTITHLIGSGFTFGIENGVRIAVAQDMIIQFCRKGYSEIYSNTQPVWVVFEYCKIHGLKYNIRNKRVYLSKHQGD